MIAMTLKSLRLSGTLMQEWAVVEAYKFSFKTSILFLMSKNADLAKYYYVIG